MNLVRVALVALGCYTKEDVSMRCYVETKMC